MDRFKRLLLATRVTRIVRGRTREKGEGLVCREQMRVGTYAALIDGMLVNCLVDND